MTDKEWMNYEPVPVGSHAAGCGHPLCNPEPPEAAEARRLEIALRKARDAA